MSVREVTMYAVACDEQGCSVSTESLGGEYSAWSDRGAALDEWLDHDNVEIRTPNGYLQFCEEHGRRFRCVECSEVSWEIGASSNRTCDHCRTELAAGANS